MDCNIDNMLSGELPVSTMENRKLDGLGREELLAMVTGLLGKVNDLTKENQRLLKREQENEVMMSYYTHGWKHISYPTLVKDAAAALFEKGADFLHLANMLYRAYNSERTLLGELLLLQLIASPDDRAVRKNFRNGFMISGVSKTPEITDIRELLNNSLDSVTMRLVMPEVDQGERITRRRSSIPNLNSLREDYIDHFLSKTSQGKTSLLEWVNTHLLNLTVKLSKEWEDIRVNNDSFAAAQMTSIFVELLTNIVLHGGSWAMLDLRTLDLSLDIYAENDCAKETGLSTSGKGIATLTSVVDRINYGSKIQNAVKRTLSDDIYTICVKLDKRLMYKEDL